MSTSIFNKLGALDTKALGSGYKDIELWIIVRNFWVQNTKSKTLSTGYTELWALDTKSFELWIQGHWVLDTKSFELWIQGHWAMNTKSFELWIQGHWAMNTKSFELWIQGHWIQRALRRQDIQENCNPLGSSWIRTWSWVLFLLPFIHSLSLLHSLCIKNILLLDNERVQHN